MDKLLKISVLLLMVLSSSVVSAQKKVPLFEQKYREAEVLFNNSLYDVAKSYYTEALIEARNSKQHQSLQNQIKQKILLMDCYEMFYHLLNQAVALELLQDFESAAKYYSDALDYAKYENLQIPDLDSIAQRIVVVEQTDHLCRTIDEIESFNADGRYEEAKNLYAEMTKKSSELRSNWQQFDFKDSFIGKIDSIGGFLENNRNDVLKYRHFSADDFLGIDRHFTALLDELASRQRKTFESVVSFSFAIDTNGVEELAVVSSNGDSSFEDELKFLLISELRFRQPHRYGFSLPTEDDISHHIVSTSKEVSVKKKKSTFRFSDSDFQNDFEEEIAGCLSAAPDGKYVFHYHTNIIEGRISKFADLKSLKGSKGRKWLKVNTVNLYKLKNS